MTQKSTHAPVSVAPFQHLLAMPPGELKKQLEAGHTIAPHTLDNTEYHGVSLGLPGWVESLTWKKFKKVFHRDPATGALRGWNVKVKQNDLDGPWEDVTKSGAPVTYGFYEVLPAATYTLPIRASHGLMIDYGLGGNHPLDPSAKLRDPLVAITPGSVDALLGMSYMDLGPVQLPTPSYFLLLRGGPLTYAAKPAWLTPFW